MKRYYSTERPVMPGGYPKPTDNPVKEIVNYDTRQNVNGIPAWGYIEYEKPLSKYDVEATGIQPMMGFVLATMWKIVVGAKITRHDGITLPVLTVNPLIR